MAEADIGLDLFGHQRDGCLDLGLRQKDAAVVLVQLGRVIQRCGIAAGLDAVEHTKHEVMHVRRAAACGEGGCLEILSGHGHAVLAIICGKQTRGYLRNVCDHERHEQHEDTKGTARDAILRIDSPVLPVTTNRLSPRGGVMNTTPSAVIIMIQNWISLISMLWASGSGIGARITMLGVAAADEGVGDQDRETRSHQQPRNDRGLEQDGGTSEHILTRHEADDDIGDRRRDQDAGARLRRDQRAGIGAGIPAFDRHSMAMPHGGGARRVRARDRRKHATNKLRGRIETVFTRHLISSATSRNFFDSPVRSSTSPVRMKSGMAVSAKWSIRETGFHRQG